MATFDTTNIPSAPDSTLDSDLTQIQAYAIQNSINVNVAPGDWLDLDPSALAADPTWGFSFQCCGTYPDGSVDILLSGGVGTQYFPCNLTASAWVQNVFRHVPVN